jgi:hypothetical protein
MKLKNYIVTTLFTILSFSYLFPVITKFDIIEENKKLKQTIAKLKKQLEKEPPDSTKIKELKKQLDQEQNRRIEITEKLKKQLAAAKKEADETDAEEAKKLKIKIEELEEQLKKEDIEEKQLKTRIETLETELEEKSKEIKELKKAPPIPSKIKRPKIKPEPEPEPELEPVKKPVKEEEEPEEEPEAEEPEDEEAEIPKAPPPPRPTKPKPIKKPKPPRPTKPKPVKEPEVEEPEKVVKDIEKFIPEKEEAEKKPPEDVDIPTPPEKVEAEEPPLGVDISKEVKDVVEEEEPPPAPPLPEEKPKPTPEKPIAEVLEIDVTKEFKTAEKLSTKTIAALETKVNKLLKIIVTLRDAKKVTKKQAVRLYKAALKLYKAGTKAKLDPSTTKVAVFKTISQFARETHKLIGKSQAGLTKKQLLLSEKRMKLLKKIADSLEGGFHFESAYRNMKREKSFLKKFTLLSAMLNKIQTSYDIKKPIKNTSSKQLKKYLMFIKALDSKIRGQITKKFGKKLTTSQLVQIIIAYKKFLDEFFKEIKKPRLADGIKKINDTGAIRAIDEIRNRYKRLGTGPVPFYLPFELHNIKKIKKNLPQQIKLFTDVVQKTITNDKRSANDALRLIIAIRKLDPQIELLHLEAYKKLLLSAKNKFAKVSRINKKRTYKKLVKLEDEYEKNVKIYELKYRDVDKSKLVTPKLTILEEIIAKAPDEFFTKVKKLKKYRTRVKNQITNIAKKIKKPGLIQRYTRLIERALKHTHFEKRYPKSLKRALLTPFKKSLKEFKDAHSDKLVYVDAIRRLAGNLGKKKTLRKKLLDEKRKREAEGKKFRNPKKLARTVKWINEYPTRKKELKTKLLAAKTDKERAKVSMGMGIGMRIPKIVQQERAKIHQRTKLKFTETFKSKKLSK